MGIRRIRLRILVCALVGFAALIVCGAAAADPPARVARLANIAGPVSFSPAGEDEWAFATPNRPLITGDRVWTDAGARAELQIGALAVRIGSLSSVTLLNLDDRIAQFQLAQGVLNVRVRRVDPGQIIEIDTPLLAFSLRAPGDYRIDVDPAGAATAVAVRSGKGEVYGEGGAAYAIGARQWYRFADSALRDYEYDALPPADAFDNWTRDRDRREDRPVAARYVSPDVIGYADLDDYGTWSSVEGYGNVWVPTSVASDWAPYHQGHWAWIEPWGWTWVDDAPWGFAPFHYGRWAYARNRWCWVPGPVRARPVYAPALVAFIGGNNFRVSVGGGGPSRGVAWFPLAPGEVYRPGYRVSRNYFTNVNISNTNVSNTYVSNVYNRPDAQNVVYRNRDQRGGVTAVPAEVFVQSRPVARSAVALTREVAAASPVTPVAAIAPVRASVIGGGPGAAPGGAPGAGQRSAPPSAPPTTMQRPVIARAAPPSAPQPFRVREAALAKDPGRPADPATFATARPVAPAAPAATVKVVAPSAPGTPPPAPTLSRPRNNALPAAAGGAPPATGGTAAPPVGVAPRPGAGVPAPQPPAAPPAIQAPPPGRERAGPLPGAGVPGPQPPAAPPAAQTPPPGRERAGPLPGATVPPPQAPPPAVQVPPRGATPPPAPVSPPPSPPSVQPVPQPPKAMERPAVQAPPAVQQAPATPPPAELRREPPPAPAVAKPPPAPVPPPAELRREAPPPPAVAKPPPAPVPPPAELRREPPPAPAVARPPPAPAPPPAELRREAPPPPAPAVARPPPAPVPPPAELRREAPPPPAAARPPVMQPAPGAPAAPAAVVRQPEPKAEPGKGEGPKKADEKRDEPK